MPQKGVSKPISLSKSTAAARSNQTIRKKTKIKASSMQPNMGFVLNDIKNFSKGLFKNKVEGPSQSHGNEIVNNNKQNSARHHMQNSSNSLGGKSIEEKGHDLAKMAKDSNLSALENTQEISSEGSNLGYERETIKTKQKAAGRSFESKRQLNPGDTISEDAINPKITVNETSEKAANSSFEKVRSKQDQRLHSETSHLQQIDHTISPKINEELPLNSDAFIETSVQMKQSSKNLESKISIQNIADNNKIVENTHKINSFHSSVNNFQKVESSKTQSTTNSQNEISVSESCIISLQDSDKSHAINYPVEKKIITNSSTDSRDSNKNKYSQDVESSSPLSLEKSSRSKSLSARRNERLRRHRQIMQRKNSLSSPANMPTQSSSSPSPETMKTPDFSVKLSSNMKSKNISAKIQRRQKGKIRSLQSQSQNNSSLSTAAVEDLNGFKVKVDWPVSSSNFDMQLDVE